MKLLIVDDEELTRNGLTEALNWEALGISEIRLADDGINGLAIARKWQPDIILCDVRMPRMDGIMMLEQIEAFLPDVTAIFMSGFSDKEYLKAAIRLKAIYYIEKPIDPAEISGAVSSAVEQCRQRLAATEPLSTGHVTGQLAYCLTIPYSSCQESVEKLLKQFNKNHKVERLSHVTTFVLKLKGLPEPPVMLPAVYERLHQYLLPMHLHVLCSEKRQNHLVFHIYGRRAPAVGTLNMIAKEMLDAFSFCEDLCLAIGPTVSGVSQVYTSYQAAVVALQSSFFFEAGRILTAEEAALLPTPDPELVLREANRFIYALSEEDEKAVFTSLDIIKDMLNHSAGLLLNQLKSVYYDMLRSLLPSDYSAASEDNLIDIIDNCSFFYQLHDILEERTRAHFKSLSDNSQESSMIRLIKTYIGTHYQNSDLSVKSVSEHINRSASYTCTLFKNETGFTLNQYITDYRMKKAAALLADPRSRITEISTSVGYNDGNYFGKSFRKYTGLSPSEYREQVLER